MVLCSKSLKRDFICKSLPVLTLGMILIYTFSIVSIYYVIEQQFDVSIKHLTDVANEGLLK